MTDWPDVVSSSAAALGLLATAWQLHRGHVQSRYDRRRATEGVSASWQILEAPSAPNGPGHAEWLYRVLIQNPGPLPIDEVVAVVDLGGTVRRIRRSGRLGEPTRTSTFRAAVLAAGGEHEWKRRVLTPLDAGAPFGTAVARLDYRDMEMRTRSTRWPRQAGDGPVARRPGLRLAPRPR